MNGSINDVVDKFLQVRATRLAIKSCVVQKEPISSTELAVCLPTRAVCDELLSHYFDLIQPVYRVLHRPSFYEDYYAFMINPQAAPATFVMQLSLVLAIGSTFYDHQDKLYIREQAQTWILSAQSWIIGPGSKSSHTLAGLQIYALLLMSKQMTYNAGGLTWVSTGSLLTMAMSMGLHYDPVSFASLTPFQRESRHRLWAVVLELCMQHHIDSATPMILSETDIVFPKILNVDDDAIHSSSEHPPMPQTRFTEASVQIQLASSLPLRLKIARLVNGIDQSTSFAHVIELGQKLKESCRGLATFSNAGSTIMPGAYEAKAASFHHKYLSVLLHRYLLLLHQRYMLASLKDASYYLARKTCVDAAQAIVAELDGAKGTDELLRLAAAGRGTFKGPFTLNVILVLSLELYTLFRDDSGGDINFSRVGRLDKLRGDARDSIRESLEKLADGTRETIRAGSVGTKSFNFITAILAGANAMEHGRCPKTAAFNSLRKTLKETMDIFQTIHPLQNQILQSPETDTAANSVFDALQSFVSGTDPSFLFDTWRLTMSSRII